MEEQTVYRTSLPLLKKADVVVVGGGAAGTCAAIAAARGGASTLLIEHYGCLGGAMTLGLVMPLSAHSTKSGKRFGGIMGELLAEIQRETVACCNGVGKDHHLFSSPHVMKHVLLTSVLESGAEILFHASVVDVLREGDRITGLVVSTKSGLVVVEGHIFIDASGDGDVIARSGEEYVSGSEAGILRNLSETGLDKVHEDDRSYGEYEQSGLMQPVTIMFTMGDVDVERASPLVNRRLRFADLGITREEFLRLPYANTPGFTVDGEDVPLPQGRVLFFKTRRPGEVVVNMTRVIGIDGTDALDLSRGETIAQKQVFYIIDFLKRFIPGFENAYLLETGDALGVRETRRLVGRHVLTGKEAIECVPFDDVIAHGSYIIDIHDPQGRRKAIGGEIHGDYYDIPYRSLLPRRIENLLVAGRCISTDHVAHSTTRIQGTCMLTGQAAGIAAALAVRDGDDPGSVAVRRIQDELIRGGVELTIRARTETVPL